MKRRLLILLATGIVAGALPGAGRARQRPSGQPASRRPTQPAGASEPVKYQPVTTRQAEANTRKAHEWADQARAFAPSLHLVETPQFLIFTAWDRSNDRPLADICQRMYKAMCGQFDIPDTQSIWAGKCPIYVFWEAEHYKRFCNEVHKGGQPDAAGYTGYGANGFAFIVIGPCRNRTAFYELLVHESTHAFLRRYLSDRNLPIWLNEGVAEYMAATLVPSAAAGTRYVAATKQAVRDDRDVRGVFDRVGLEEFDYGIAQSFVRFLVAADRKRFVQLVRLIKEGTGEEEALKQSYGWTREQFLRQWADAAIRAVR